MDRVVNKQVPIIFQKLNSFETVDTRFMKVKIWLMHLGENLNGSFFSKEIVQKAIPTLANTPILAYIEAKEDGENDFSDHRSVLVKEDGQYKIKYIGQAIGVIPETNNAQFEMRLCDDGIEREFLTVEGLVWQNKWDDAPDILNRDKVKAQSMELHDDYQGEWGDDNLFHFTDFKFYGACGLGTGVLPAMVNSTIEVQFSNDTFAQEINSKMEEFKKYMFQKGGMTVDEKLELLKKFNITQEQLTFSIDEMSIEELEVKLTEMTKEPETKEFSLSGQQFIEELSNQLRAEKYTDRWGDQYSQYSYVDFKDNLVFAYDRQDNWRLYGFNFTVEGDKITIDFATKKRKKFEIVDFEEGQVEVVFELFPQEAVEYQVADAKRELESNFATEKENAVNEVQIKLDEVTTNYTNLESKVNTLTQELSTYQAKEIAEQRESIYSQFSENFTDEEMESIKEDTKEIKNEQLEDKLFALVGKKKAKFTKSEKRDKAVVKIVTQIEDGDCPYPGLLGLYNKVK